MWDKIEMAVTKMREEDSSYQLPGPFEQAVQNWMAAIIAAGHQRQKTANLIMKA